MSLFFLNSKSTLDTGMFGLIYILLLAISLIYTLVILFIYFFFLTILISSIICLILSDISNISSLGLCIKYPCPYFIPILIRVLSSSSVSIPSAIKIEFVTLEKSYILVTSACFVLSLSILRIS